MANEMTIESIRKDIEDTYKPSAKRSTLIFLTDQSRTHIAELTGHRLVTNDETGEKVVMISANIIETSRIPRNRENNTVEEEATKAVATKSVKSKT